MEDAAIFEESSRKSSKDHNLLVSDLDNTGSLALWELNLGNVDNDPGVGSVLRIVALNRVTVLLSRLGNAAEDEDEAISVGTARVIVSTDVEIGDLEPQIKINVILLRTLVRFIIFATRTSDDQELVVQTAHRVAMASILHIVHAQAVKGIGSVVDDLEALLEGGGLSLDIASADQEDLVARGLHIGEVVLEGLLNVHLAAEDLFLGDVVFVDVLGVALKNVDRLQVTSVLALIRNLHLVNRG